MKAKEYLQQVKMIDVQIDQDKDRQSEATQTDKSKEQISKEIEKLIMIKNQVIHEITEVLFIFLIVLCAARVLKPLTLQHFLL